MTVGFPPTSFTVSDERMYFFIRASEHQQKSYEVEILFLTRSSDLNLDWGSLDQTEAPSASSKAFRNPEPTSLQICG